MPTSRLQAATRRPSCVADYDSILCGTNLCSIDITGYPCPHHVNDHSGGVCVRESSRLGVTLSSADLSGVGLCGVCLSGLGHSEVGLSGARISDSGPHINTY